jgi:peroxiredoxin family protein
MSEEEIKKLVDKLVEEKLQERLDPLVADTLQLKQQVEKIEKLMPKDKITILVTSFELDHLLPAFIIAAGAASFGMEVTMFFTLWGINAVKEKNIYSGKSIKEKMITFMLPSTPKSTVISRMNMMGVGTAMMKEMMKENNVETLPDLIDLSAELEVKMMACQMTMGIMGITREELRSDVTYGGVAAYIEEASDAKVTLCF